MVVLVVVLVVLVVVVVVVVVRGDTVHKQGAFAPKLPSLSFLCPAAEKKKTTFEDQRKAVVEEKNREARRDSRAGLGLRLGFPLLIPDILILTREVRPAQCTVGARRF